MTTAPSTVTSADPLVLYGETFSSRLLLGTSRYPSPRILEEAVRKAQPAMLTASLRRQNMSANDSPNRFWDMLRQLDVPVLPNTAGCHLSLIHISEPTRRTPISYAVFCLK